VTNRPKAIGTQAETAVVHAARRHGFPGAERRALRGRHDVGDVLLCPGVILEVKGGQAARTASDALVSAWLTETERERVNAGAAVAVLVTVRPGVGPVNADRWTAHLRVGHLAQLRGWPACEPVDATPVRLALGDALAILRAGGYGDPLSDADEPDSDPAPADLCTCGHVRRIHGSRPGCDLPDDRCRAPRCSCPDFTGATP
jgi:hypothetical protein